MSHPPPPTTAHDAQRSTPARLAAVGAVAVAALLVALIMLSAGEPYRVKGTFLNAGQLVKGNQVQVGGRAVGSVKGIGLTPDGQAEVEIEVSDGDLTPLHRGTTAVIRASSLSGIANRYVSLAPGPASAPEIPSGGRVGADRTTAPVDLDQLLDTLDGDTRRGLRRVIRGSATQYEGRSRQAAESLRYLSPTLAQTSAVMRELNRDSQAFERFVVDTAATVGALAERRDELSRLVGNAGTATKAIGDENEALARALGLLPGTLRKASTTFVNLRSALDDLDTLVAESKPATKDLAPFLRRPRPLVAEARPAVRDLSETVRARGPDNDLIEMLRAGPRLARLGGRALPRSVRALRRAQPVVEYLRPYSAELIGWLRDFGQAAATYDANGHYARISPAFNAFAYSEGSEGPVLDAVPPSQRLLGLETGAVARCPGAAAQYPPDGSAPFLDGGRLSCDPGDEPPGAP